MSFDCCSACSYRSDRITLDFCVLCSAVWCAVSLFSFVLAIGMYPLHRRCAVLRHSLRSHDARRWFTFRSHITRGRLICGGSSVRLPLLTSRAASMSMVSHPNGLVINCTHLAKKWQSTIGWCVHLATYAPQIRIWRAALAGRQSAQAARQKGAQFSSAIYIVVQCVYNCAYIDF